MPRYWVEFGAYDRPYYAQRLRESLDRLGIPTSVTEAPGRHGRTYLRVRTEAEFDRAAAVTQLGKVKTALHITPLLHRAAATSPGAARIAAPKPAGHWVQFGAYRSRTGASGVAATLRSNGVQASVLETKYDGKGVLYLVRATGLQNRATAVRIARQGSAALHINHVLIGAAGPRRVSPSRALHPRPPPG